MLSLGGLLAKVLGALYRIPLTNILGSYGMGLYQLVFPPYILFLTVSQAGIPVALSKTIAEKLQLRQPKQAQKDTFPRTVTTQTAVVHRLHPSEQSTVLLRHPGTVTLFSLSAEASGVKR